MENLDLLNNDLQVTPQAQSYLTESAKWGKFLAIMGFIFCGLMVILAFFVPALFRRRHSIVALPASFRFRYESRHDGCLFINGGIIIFSVPLFI